METYPNSTVRLESDGPDVWSNRSLRATQDEPLLTGLSVDQAAYLVANEPFELANDADPNADVEGSVSGAGGSAASDADDGAGTSTSPLFGEGEGENEDEDADADVDAESGDSDSEDEDEDADPEETDLESIDGVGPATANKLRGAGFESANDVRAASKDDLVSAGVSERIASNISNNSDDSNSNGED